MEFVLHTGMDEQQPWTNKTCQSRNRRELMERSGSRYAPASPCDGLEAIEKSSRSCVFIGKPCDRPLQSWRFGNNGQHYPKSLDWF